MGVLAASGVAAALFLGVPLAGVFATTLVAVLGVFAVLGVA